MEMQHQPSLSNAMATMVHDPVGQQAVDGSVAAKPFYLDTALCYRAAMAAGVSDRHVASVGQVHLRTVRWYLRIADWPEACHDLMRLYPKLFSATWAVHIARRGFTPHIYPDLVRQMQQMAMANRSWIPKSKQPRHGKRSRATPSSHAETTIEALRRRLDAPEAKALAEFSRSLIRLLERGELIDTMTHKRIHRALWPHLDVSSS